MKAIIYCRVSTREQVDNLSLETQEKACREFCERGGGEVCRVFVEEGESAKTLNRKQLRQLMDYCRKNKQAVDRVIVYSLSRLSRAAHDHQVLRAYLLGLGITLRSATEPIDDTSTGKLMETILSGFAQFDNDVRSDRTKAGMETALRLGKWTFSPPDRVLEGKG